LKVLYLNPTVAIGGAERSLIELVSGVDRELVEPLAACVMEGPLTQALREAGARVELNPWPAFALRIGRGSFLSKLLLPFAAIVLIPHVLRLAGMVRREKIAIIHTNGLKSNVIGSVVRLLTGCKLVWHVRDVLQPGMTRSVFGALARWTVTCLVANSRAVAETFPGMPAGRIRVIYNGLDTDLYAPGPPREDVRSALGLSGESFVIGAIGALAPLKGHIHLIRAVPQILKVAPRAKVVIVGQEMYLTLGHEGYRSVLEKEIDARGVRDHVVLSGYRDDPVEVLRCFDVLVHASIYPESFGRVLAEAMACGVPVVATGLGGPLEIIAEPGQGILIPAGDPGAIAAAILSLHGDPDRRRKMSAAGRRRVESAFGRRRYLREVEALYRDVAA